MALATSVVSGAAIVIGGSTETGSYAKSVTRKKTDAETGKEVDTEFTLTTYYSETRTTKKWYALTLSACTAYIAANPTLQITYDLDNAATGGYTLTATTVARTVTGFTLLEVPEQAT